jgi:hypothetical protein
MIAKFIGIVKQQISFWRYQVTTYGPGHPEYRPAKIAKYEYLIRDFTELLKYLEAQEKDRPPAFADQPQPRFPDELSAPAIIRPAATPPPTQQNTQDDLSDLPPELLKELSDSAKGETDVLIKIIDGRGGTATLDEILIDLYRKHKEIGKRPLIANKLYRLSRRELCWSVPGRKGAYTTTKPDGIAETPSESDEGSDAATSEPSSKEQGVAGSPDRPLNPSPVGSTPTASTQLRRKLLSETSVPSPLRRRL